MLATIDNEEVLKGAQLSRAEASLHVDYAFFHLSVLGELSLLQSTLKGLDRVEPCS